MPLPLPLPPRGTFLPLTRGLMSNLTSSFWPSFVPWFGELRGSALPEAFDLGVGQGDGGAGAYSDPPESEPALDNDGENDGVGLRASKEAWSEDEGLRVGRADVREYGVDLSERGLGVGVTGMARRTLGR